jgi:glycosyltransferase involved in cell wall biosynthesis
VPRVSVIVPTFNRAQFIADAIESVLSQSYRDFELIVVDDGSTDRTGEIVSSIHDPRLIFIRQENRGRSHARNAALNIAQGELVAFLDSDDLYLPGKLEMQVAYMERHPEAGMIYTSARCIDQHGADLPARYRATHSGKIYKHIAFFRPVTITLPTVMVRRSLLTKVGGFDEHMSRFEDTDMWRRLSKEISIHAIDVDTCKLRTHASNTLSAQNPDQIASSLEYYVGKMFDEDSELPGLSVRRRLGALYFYYGKAFMSVPGWRLHGRRMLVTAVRYWPLYSPMMLTIIARYAILPPSRTT